jgi:cyclic lactone autoinducer peptide
MELIYFNGYIHKEQIEVKNEKEEKQMITGEAIRISKFAKRNIILGGSAVLMMLAAFFASVSCLGHFYEPEVPQKLLEKRNGLK